MAMAGKGISLMMDLTASYQYCATIARESGSNFYRSFSLLEPQRRQAMEALYAFARWSDDLSDLPGEANQKRSRLEHWQAELERYCHGNEIPEIASNQDPQTDVNLLWPALRDAQQRYRIPIEVLRDLVEGVKLDIDMVRLRDRDQLERYCYCVAGTVGLACLHIWEAPVDRLRNVAIDCGFAFQITNILRDVLEDTRRQRIYLPEADLQVYGCDAASWLRAEPAGDWLGLVRKYITDADAAYRRSWEIHTHLPPDAKKMFSLMWRSYHAILEEIQRQPETIWKRRLSVPLWKKAKLFLTHFGPLS
jgi:phytoene synthase